MLIHRETSLEAVTLLRPPTTLSLKQQSFPESELLVLFDTFRVSTVEKLIAWSKSCGSYVLVVMRSRISRFPGKNLTPIEYDREVLRLLAVFPVYRDFCDSRYHTRSWVSDLLIESPVLDDVDPDASLETVAAHAFAQVIGSDESPSGTDARWIVQHLEALKPHAALLRERGDCSREFLETVISSSTPALVEGLL